MTEQRSISTGSAPAEVVHGAIQLLRAEVKVALVHVRAFAVQAGIALVFGIFSLIMLQAALILTVLSPLLFDRLSQGMALLALAVPYLGAVIGAVLAYVSWRKACSPAPSEWREQPSQRQRNEE